MTDPLQTRPEALLPHGAAARFIHRIVRAEPGLLIAAAWVPAPIMAVADHVPCFLGLEIGAQAAAVLESLVQARRAGDHARRIGYLVGVRTATFSQAGLPVNTGSRSALA